MTLVAWEGNHASRGHPVIVVVAVTIVVDKIQTRSTGEVEFKKWQRLCLVVIIEDRINEMIALFPKYFF